LVVRNALKVGRQACIRFEVERLCDVVGKITGSTAVISGFESEEM
jgi:hypothetical protein